MHINKLKKYFPSKTKIFVPQMENFLGLEVQLAIKRENFLDNINSSTLKLTIRNSSLQPSNDLNEVGDVTSYTSIQQSAPR